MSIILAPRPTENYTQIPNEVLRRTDMSLRAKGLLSMLLSHVDGWKTSAEALSAQLPEGRDAIRTTLRELETLGYLRRARIQNPTTGFWSTDMWVFPHPVPEDFDVMAYVAAQEAAKSRVAEEEARLAALFAPREPVDNSAPDWAKDASAVEHEFDGATKPQVTPTTDFQSSVFQSSGIQSSGEPTVGFSGANKKNKKKTKTVGEVGTSLTTGRDPRPAPPTEIQTTRGKPRGWDEFGPETPWCLEHPGGTDAPCGRCASWRERYEIAHPKREEARRREAERREVEAERARLAAGRVPSNAPLARQKIAEMRDKVSAVKP